MTSHHSIRTETAAPPIGPYSQGIRWERLIFTSSVGTSNPIHGGEAPTGDVSAAARNALENLRQILQAGGSSLQHVLKVTLYLRTMDDFAAVNTVYAQFFSADPRPARSLVAVAGARGLVSFDAIAYIPD